MPLPTGSPRAQGTLGPQPRFWNRTSPASGGMAGPGAGARTGQGSRTGSAACLEASEERAVHPAESDGHRKVPPPCGKRIYRKAPVFLQQFPLDFLFVLYQLVARLSGIPFRGLSSPDRPSCRQTGKAGQPDVRGFLRRASVDARDACRGARRRGSGAGAVRHLDARAAGRGRPPQPAPPLHGNPRGAAARQGAGGLWTVPGGNLPVPVDGTGYRFSHSVSCRNRRGRNHRNGQWTGLECPEPSGGNPEAARPGRGAPAPCRRQASTHHDRPRVRRDA